MNMTQDELMEIVKRHGQWLRYEDVGNRADLSGSDLSGANLSGASLSGADLSGANLSGVVGGNSRMQCLQIEPYKIIIIDSETVWGGCAKKTAQEWLEYAGEELSAPDRKYLETITKPFIRMCLAISSNQE